MEANSLQDIWFHRYQDGRDIEGRFDYNSWQESPTGLKLAASLDRDVVLAEGKIHLQFSSSRSQSDNSQATRNTTPTASTWPAWATGARTRTSRFLLTAWEASASL
jgi:hypothetical protein